MEDFSKRNMKEFVRYFALGLWGLATCATCAHAWNVKEHAVISIAALLAFAGTAFAIVKFAKEVKAKVKEEMEKEEK